MATTIDQKVVEMKFDNKDFEKNTRQTMSTLDKLKAKLHFKGASDGLQEVSKAARKVDMNGLADGIQTVSAKFSAMEIIGTTALVNITNSAVNAGKRMISAISFDQISAGWNKMGQQMSSMQTLMNSTGKELDEIEGYLNELMWYSDETSYGFTDMTAALANMTATGGKIEKLVPMIMGMANATAYAGKGAAEFSRVIYNLNQSYGGGYLTLMDWKSVKLAGANSKQLTESLIRWGEALGTIKKGQVSISNFDDTLKDKWATTEVMEKAFGEFAEITLKVKEMVDSGEYDTASEAIDALGDEYKGVSLQAFKAAQEAKSFSEAIDATKDAVSSKWMNIFKTIFGNYEEQRQLWTDLANSLWDIFAGPLDELQAYLSKALGFDKIKEVWDKINNNPIMDAIKEVDGAVKKSSKSLQEYQDIVRKVWNGDFNNRGDNPDRFDLLSQQGWDPRVVQSLVNKTDDIAGHGKGWTVIDKLTIDDVTAAEQKYGIQIDKTTMSIQDQKKTQKELDKLTDEYLRDTCKLTDTQIELYHDLVDASRKYGISIDEIIKKMENTNGRQHLEGSWREIGFIIKETLGSIGKAFGEVYHFNPINLYLSLEKLHEKLIKVRETLIGKEVEEDGKKIFKYSKHYENLVDTLKGLISIFKLASTIVGGGFKIALTIINTILKTFGLTILDVTGAIGNIISELVAWIEENEFIIKGIQWLVTTIMGGINKLWDWADAQWGINKAIKGFIKILKGGKNGLKTWIEGLMAADDVGKYLADTFGKIPDKIKKLWEAFKQTKIGQVVLSWWKAIKESDFGKAIAGWFDGLKNLDFIQKLKNYFNSFDTGSIGKNIVLGLWEGVKKYSKIAIDGIKNFGIWILEGIKKVLGIHSPSTEFFEIGKNIILGLFNGIKSLVVMVYELVKTVGGKIIDIIKDFDIGSVFVALVSAGAIFGLIKLAQALNILAGGLQNINSVIGEFAGVLKAFKGVLKAFKVKLITSAMKDVAISVAILTASIFVLTKLDVGQMFIAIGTIAALVAIMGALVICAGRFGKGEGLKFGKLAVTILAVGVAMGLMASALKKIASIENVSWQALTIFGSMLLTLIAIAVLSGRNSAKILELSGTMVGIGVAIYLMAKAVKGLKDLSWREIAKGITALGGFMIMIGILALCTKKISKSQNIDKFANMLLKVGVAFYMMAVVTKKLGHMDPAELKQGKNALWSFVGMISVLMVATRMLTGTKNVAAIGSTLAAVGVAILMMGITTKLLGSMDPGQLLKGGIAVAAFVGIIIGLIWSIKKIGGKDIENINKTLLGVAACIGVMTLAAVLLGLMDIAKLAKGIVAVGILTFFITQLIKSTENARNVGKGLWPIVAAISILALAVGILSVLDPKRLIAPTIAMGLLMGVFSIMIKMAKDIGGQKGVFKNIMMMTILVGLIGGLIFALSFIDIKDQLGVVASISLLLLALAGAVTMLGKVKINPKDLLVGIVGMVAIILALIPLLAVVGILSLFGNAAPTLLALSVFLGALTVMLLGVAAVGAIYTATGGMAMLGILGVYALLPALLGLMTGVVALVALLSIIPNAMQGFIMLSSMFGVLTGMLLVLALVGPAALVGVTALGALIALLVPLMLFCTILGALTTYIPALEEFLNKGLQVLIMVAGGLGEMIGAFVSGVFTQISGVLPQIGTDLSMFMMNAMPFIMGAKLVDGKVLKGVSILSLAILELAAASLIEGIANLLPFCPSFAQMGKDLSAFMAYALPFIMGAKMIDQGTAIGIKALASAMLSLTASELLNGLAGFLGQQASLDEFGRQLPGLGTGLAGFVKELGEFSEAQVTTVECAGTAVEKLADTAKKLPREGGVWGALAGESSLADFSDSLPDVAKGIVGFVNELGEFSDPQIKTTECACKALEALAEVTKKLPKEKGFWQKLAGEQSLKDFADDLPGVAEGIVGFVNKLGNFGDKTKCVEAAGNVINGLAELAKQDLKKAGEQLPGFGDKANEFGDKLKSFIDKFKDVSEEDAKNTTGVITVIAEAAKTMIEKIKSTFNENADGIITSVADIANKAADALGSDSVISKVKDKAKNFVQGFANGINENQSLATYAAEQLSQKALNQMNKTLDEHSPSKETHKQGAFFGEGFVMGINEYSSKVYRVSENVGNEAKRGLSAAIAKVSSLIESDMDANPTIRPVLDLSEVSDGAGYINSMFGNPSMQLAANLNSISSGMKSRIQNGNSDVVSAIDKLGKNLGNGGNTYNFGGITYSDDGPINSAIKELIRAVDIERRV